MLSIEDPQLQLVEAFAKLRDLVMSGYMLDCNSGLDKDTIWRCYVTMAVRRFNIYVNALKMKFPRPNQFPELEEFIKNHLPPIDILMVWFYFEEIPNAFYANFHVDDFLRFTKCTFPLVEIATLIDSNSMFNVESETVDEVTKLINRYTNSIFRRELFEYDSYMPFDSNVTVPIFCPVCWHKLGMHPLTTAQSNGFAEGNFTMTSPNPCACFKYHTVTKDSIRVRLMGKEQKSPKSRYTRIKYFDYYLGSFSKIKGLRPYFSKIFGTLDLETLSWSRTPLGMRGLSIETYIDINPISSTIPTSTTLYIREDLVALIVSRGNFIDKMVSFD